MRLIRSMHRCCDAVVASNGGHTWYWLTEIQWWTMELINRFVIMHCYPVVYWNYFSFNQYYCYDFVFEMKSGITLLLTTVILMYPSWKFESLIVFYELGIKMFDTAVVFLTVYIFVSSSTTWQDIADIKYHHPLYVGDREFGHGYKSFWSHVYIFHSC